MLVTIVGATGVLGRNLIPLLLRKGYKVRALARSVERIKASFGDRVEAAEADLLQPGIDQSLPDLLAGSAAVIHIATAIPADRQAPGAWETTARLRTEGTRSLIAASLAAGISCYIQQSIAMAYPDCGDRWIDENIPFDPSPDRAATNAPVIRMESMVRSISTAKMRWCILRGGMFVGPETFQDGTISRLQKGEEFVPCSGQYFVSYLHVADMASAITAALHRAPAGSILNITADPVREGEYLDRLAVRNGAALPRRDPDMPCPPSIRCCNQVAQDLLKWKPSYSIYRQPGES